MAFNFRRRSHKEDANTEARKARPAFARFVADDMNQPIAEHTSSAGVLVLRLAVFAVVFAIVIALFRLASGTYPIAAWPIAAVCALLATMSVNVAQQWERAVVLRLGRLSRVVGPGIFFIIPIIESVSACVDCRLRATTFDAEETLTSDLVPLDVNAAFFWVVFDAGTACTECSDFSRTVELAAQATLRDAIGRMSVAEVAIRREQLDEDIKAILDDNVGQWGISIIDVKIRDIFLPQHLQDVMSLEAQAEQRRKARIALMEAEEDIAAMIDNVSNSYGGDDAALRLRAMHLLYESVRETGGTIVVPSSFSEGFGDILPDGTLTQSTRNYPQNR